MAISDHAYYMMHFVDFYQDALYTMHMDLREIGESIRLARKTSRRTQSDVAAPLGMSRATVSALENGTLNEIGVRKLVALCTSLGLELTVGPRGHRPTLTDLREEHRAALKSRT